MIIMIVDKAVHDRPGIHCKKIRLVIGLVTYLLLSAQCSVVRKLVTGQVTRLVQAQKTRAT